MNHRYSRCKKYCHQPICLGWLVIFWCMIIGQTGHASDAQPARDAAAVTNMLKNLRGQAQQAQETLVSTRKDIEAQRQEKIRHMAQLRAQLQDLQQQHQELIQQQTSLQATHKDLQQQFAQQHTVTQGLRRLFLQEGLLPFAHAQASGLDWSLITTQLHQRLQSAQIDQQHQLLTQPIVSRQGKVENTSVWQWGAMQRWGVGQSKDHAGIAERLDDGQWQITGPLLDASFIDRPNANTSASTSKSQHTMKEFSQSGLRFVVAPFDVSGRLHTQPAQAQDVAGIIQRAGAFAWPIIAVAVVGLLICLDRLWLMWRWRQPPGNPEQHLSPTARNLSPIETIVLAATSNRENATLANRQQRTGAALVDAEIRLQRGLRLLAVLAAAAPLLGLLGTVTGMITSFEALDVSSGGNAGQLSAGIGEALLTTEFGLIVAVPLLLCHAVFSRDAQRRRAQAEATAMRLLAAPHDSSINRDV